MWLPRCGEVNEDSAVGEDLVETGEHRGKRFLQSGAGGMDVAATAELASKAIHIDQRRRLVRKCRL